MKASSAPAQATDGISFVLARVSHSYKSKAVLCKSPEFENPFSMRTSSFQSSFVRFLPSELKIFVNVECLPKLAAKSRCCTGGDISDCRVSPKTGC